MKTKLTLLIAVLAIVLFGCGCASTKPGNLLWRQVWTDGSEPYSWALDKGGNFYVTRYHGKSTVLDGKTGEVKSKFHGGLYSVSIGDNGVSYYGARGSVTANPIGLDIGRSDFTDRIKWTFGSMYKGNVHAGTSHLAVGADGTVFVGYEGDIWAIDGKKGTEKWRVTPADVGIEKFQFSTLICGKDDKVYSRIGNKLIALQTSTGKRIWEFDAGQDGIRTGYSQRCWAIGRDETIYIGLEREIIALSGKTGIMKWKSRINVQPNGAIIIGEDGTVYFSGAAGFYALDGETGDWKWDNPSAGSSLGGALGASGTIYVAVTESKQHKIMALDEKTGETKWQFKFQNGEKFHGHDGLIIGNNGNIYFATMKAVYAVQGNSNAPSNSVWPMGGQNAQRTNRAK